MRDLSHSQVAWVMSALALSLMMVLADVVPAGGPEGSGGKAVAAKFVEISGAVEINSPGQATRVPKPGDYVYAGEELIVRKGSAATLAMSDRTLREFVGPTTLTVGPEAGQGGTVLANLTVAVADMLFSSKVQTSDAVMATRAAATTGGISVPVLVRPARGENLVEMPREFKWAPVQGVPLYRVSVYNSAQIMWQTTTSESNARWPAKDCEFLPGQVYYWVVEAVIGNTTLRSEAGDFSILTRDGGLDLTKALGEIDTSVPDPTTAMVLKARLCMDSRAFSKALEVVDASLQASPTRTAYALRAEINDAVGRMADAVADYRRAMALPAAD